MWVSWRIGSVVEGGEHTTVWTRSNATDAAMRTQRNAIQRIASLSLLNEIWTATPPFACHLLHWYPSSCFAHPSTLQKLWTRSFASLLSNYVRSVERVMEAWCGRLWGELIHCGVLWRFWGMIHIHTSYIPLVFFSLIIHIFPQLEYQLFSSHTRLNINKTPQQYLSFIISTITLPLRIKERWEVRGERWEVRGERWLEG